MAELTIISSQLRQELQLMHGKKNHASYMCYRAQQRILHFMYEGRQVNHACCLFHRQHLSCLSHTAGMCTTGRELRFARPLFADLPIECLAGVAFIAQIASHA